MRQRASLTFSLLLMLLAPGLTAHAVPVTAPHLTVELISPQPALYPGKQLEIGLNFRLDPGWHIYWINAGDSGEPPSIRWQLPAGITAGPMQFPAPRRLPLGPLMDYGYEKQVLFPMVLRVAEDWKPEGSTATLNAKVNWLVCREVCIPGKTQVSYSAAAFASRPAAEPQDTAAAQLFADAAARLPQPLPQGATARFAARGQQLVLQVTTGSRATDALFFPFDHGQITNAAPQTVRPLAHGVEITLVRDPALKTPPAELHGLVEVGGKSYEVTAPQGALASAGEERPAALARNLVLAFAGGLILNLMPCVFPVLFIKALSLVQSSREQRSLMRAHAWVYAAGIVVSFWIVVALLLGLRAAGRQLGWGFQFQSPGFVAVMALLLFFLGLSLAGLFEIGLSLTSAGGGLAQRTGYAGSFFTGVLAMVVATPCTAPFMGAAIGYALAHSPQVSFAVFTALALGLAAPYLLLAYQPAWIRLLPRPGAWMEVLKQATSVPVFGTVIWLAWLFGQSAGVNALAALLAGFLVLAVAGWVLGRWPARRAGTAAALLLAAFGVALPLVAVSRSAAPVQAAASPRETRWQPFTPEIVGRLRAQGKPVFVDFTASWCLSCQVNERVVLDREDVQQALRKNGVALVRADWTRHDATIAQALSELGRSGVPTYVFYPADPARAPKLLPEVLTPGLVIDAAASAAR